MDDIPMTQEQLRRLDAEYQALCAAIEREATEGGFANFLRDPANLRKRTKHLAEQGLCEYPDNEQIEYFLKFVPETLDFPLK